MAPEIPVDRIIATLKENVYLTFDLDGLDTSIMPSTGTPEPGGLGWYEVLNLIKEVAEKNITGESFYLKYRTIHKDGNIVWINNQSTYLKDDEGRIRFVHGVMLDVSIHQKAIEEIEKANKAKSEFMARMSHEVRTPLNAVLGFSELLRESGLTSAQFEYLDMIAKNGRHLLELVNDIFDFSKLETKKIVLNNEPFYLDAVISEIIGLARPLLKNNGISLTTEFERKNLYLNGDKLRTNQILSNLILNAVKFTEAGKIAVEVTIESETIETIILKINVRDTGIGIRKDYIDKIFSPFDQADGSLTRKFGGAGIGLTITKRLTELMNGNISFLSEEGKGSVFTVKIPFKKINDAQPGKKENVNYSESNSISSDKNYKILVVEDNPTNQRLVKIILQKSGYAVELADNGQVCLEKLEQGKFDFIFMDMEMPVMDGVTATVELRKKYKDIPVVALTANVFEEARKICMQAGMNDFLTKPFTSETIIATVEKWLFNK